MKTFTLFLALAVAAIAQTAHDPGRAVVGKTVTITVNTEGTPPFTYQWVKDGTAIPGQTGSVLMLKPFLAEHAGIYHVTISNEAGSTVSNKVQLTPVSVPSKATITVSIAVGTVNP